MTPYERNGKKPVRANYLKEFGFQGDLLWRLDSAKYQDRADALKRQKENLKIQAQRAKQEQQLKKEKTMAEPKKVATTPKKATNNDGFVPISKTITTTFQNSKGVKRVIKETTTAPKAKKPAKAQKDYGRFNVFASSLSEMSPTPVKFARTADGKGSITFKFASDEELQQLVDLFEKMKMQ